VISLTSGPTSGLPASYVGFGVGAGVGGVVPTDVDPNTAAVPDLSTEASLKTALPEPTKDVLIAARMLSSSILVTNCVLAIVKLLISNPSTGPVHVKEIFTMPMVAVDKPPSSNETV